MYDKYTEAFKGKIMEKLPGGQRPRSSRPTSSPTSSRIGKVIPFWHLPDLVHTR